LLVDSRHGSVVVETALARVEVPVGAKIEIILDSAGLRVASLRHAKRRRTSAHTGGSSDRATRTNRVTFDTIGR
jgi:hypothetical protein